MAEGFWVQFYGMEGHGATLSMLLLLLGQVVRQPTDHVNEIKGNAEARSTMYPKLGQI